MRIDRIIQKEINILFYATPLVYAIAKIIDNQNLYIFKDILMLFICFQIFILIVNNHVLIDKQSFAIIFVYCTYIILDSLLQLEDTRYWLISLREILVTPLMLILIGMFLKYNGVDYLEYARKPILFSCFLTVVFALVFQNLSFGETNRLSSFWDREHEPAIIGGLLIVSTMAYQKNIQQYNWKKCIVPFLMAGYCVVMSASRSAILAIIVTLLFIYSDKLKAKNIIAILIISIIGYVIAGNYSIFTNRDLSYNLNPRINQYTMALNLIYEKPIFGIGIDKYGVLAGTSSKSFTYNGITTTTMDSSILKYLVNLGLLFAVIEIVLFVRAYSNCKNINRNIYLYIVFGLVIGSVTGKMGAYPLNQYFYTALGYVLFGKEEKYGYRTKNQLSAE
jgi:O-antigen ligase